MNKITTTWIKFPAKNELASEKKSFLNRIFGLKKSFLNQTTYVLKQGRASGMDCTLHTDLWESETSRDIKK